MHPSRGGPAQQMLHQPQTNATYILIGRAVAHKNQTKAIHQGQINTNQARAQDRGEIVMNMVESGVIREVIGGMIGGEMMIEVEGGKKMILGGEMIGVIEGKMIRKGMTVGGGIVIVM